MRKLCIIKNGSPTGDYPYAIPGSDLDKYLQDCMCHGDTVYMSTGR